jgi:hypothetical protein
MPLGVIASGCLDRDRHIHITLHGVGIWANSVSGRDELFSICLCKPANGRDQSHLQPEASIRFGTDANCGLDRDRSGFELQLGPHEFAGAAEAGGVAGSEQILGCRRARLARPAHRLGYRQLHVHQSVIRARTTVSSAHRSGMGCIEHVDTDFISPVSKKLAFPFAKSRRRSLALFLAPIALH